MHPGAITRPLRHPPRPHPPPPAPSTPLTLSFFAFFFCVRVCVCVLPLSPPPPPSPPRRRGYLFPTVQNRLDITVHQFQPTPLLSPCDSPPHPEVVCIKSGPVKLQVEIGRPEPDSGGENEGGRRQLKAGESQP